MKLTSPSTVMELLREKGIRPKRGLGQHFLCDENILEKIVAAAELSPDELVIEPGAGLGTLTLALAARAGRVIAVELDPRLIPILQANIAAARADNVRVIAQDFLKLGLAELVVAAGEKRAKVVGNLPYGITSPILEKLMAERGALGSAVLMVQYELAEKLAAPPGARANALGVQLQALAEVKLLFRVPRGVFLPPPEVDSAVIRLSFRKRPRFETDERVFSQVVRAAFNLRRKTIKQALIRSPLLRLPEERAVQALQEAGILERRRGESLSIEEFDRLAQAIQRG
ncbi:MAG: 16S rRNA (adenine(1518)-N(6)/adenine(1519)-N(6))-dimethyltransferase RsmA [Candidatus Bipolaricaulia bacterium]